MWNAAKKPKVVLFLVAHAPLCRAFKKTLEQILSLQPEDFIFLPVDLSTKPEACAAKGVKLISKIKGVENVLLLTDLPGATPHRVALSIASQLQLPNKLFTGVSLPILLRLINYQHLSLDELIQIALEGGIKSMHTPYLMVE